MTLSERRVRITRDGVLFFCGLTGIAHETLIAQTDRPTLLILFAGMIGLPPVLRRDEKNQEKEDDARDTPDRT